MKPIEQAFLADILESPDDDAPRLIYADWLEEDWQEERAEFIRVQCEIARTRCSSQPRCELFNEGLPKEAQGWCMECCRLYALRCRERELLGQQSTLFRYRQTIYSDFGPQFRWSDSPNMENAVQFTFRRGFIEEVAIPLAAWLQHGPALVRAAPLRVVRLSDFPPTRISLADYDGPWIYREESYGGIWPLAFDDAVFLTHNTEADALTAMSRCCLEYAHGKDSKTVPA